MQVGGNKLKVKELIEKLQSYDPEMKVQAEIDYGAYADIEDLKIVPDWIFLAGERPRESKMVLLSTDWSSALPDADDTNYEV